jgi:hypothetical protein
LLCVESEDFDRARRLLTRPLMKEALSQLFDRHPEARIELATLTANLGNWRTPKQRIDSRLAPICAAVHAFQQLTDWPEKRDAVTTRRNAQAA